jgi:molybdopterin/thiamine biosynthesis adenylyltransferase
LGVDRSLQARIRESAEATEGIEAIALERVQALAGEFGVSLREVELTALEARVLPRRYLRSLGTVGWEGQIRLLRSTVAVVGLGGLGGNVVEGLARMGVGRLIVVDGDVFLDHNLNRQVLCSEDDVGLVKAEVTQSKIIQINAAVEVIVHIEEATRENLPRLLDGAEVVVDALDRLPSRLMLQGVAQEMGIPMVHGAIAGYSGQVMTIFPGDGGLRALFGGGSVPERGLEVQLGCPAATPMMVAAWQVQEVLKILLGRGQLLRHKVLFMDAEAGTVDFLEIGS